MPDDAIQPISPDESLFRSEERFRLLVASVKDYAIFMLDPTGVVATWNEGAERIKGYRAEEIIGQHFSRFYPETDLAAGKPALGLKTAAEAGRYEDEGWRVRKDGSRFWANVVITALRSEQGTLVGFAKVTRDLSERQRVEQARLELAQQVAATRAAENVVARLERLHAVVSALGAAYTTEQIGEVILHQASSALGASAAVLLVTVGERLQEVGRRGAESALTKLLGSDPTPGADAYRAREVQWLDDSAGFSERYPHLGPIAPGEIVVALPLLLSDRLLGIAAFVLAPGAGAREERALMESLADHTAQALDRAGAYARELEARASLSTTLRSIGDAVIATDASGAITLMNPVAEALTAWPEAEARGQSLISVFRIVNETTREPVENPVDRVLAHGVVAGLANHTVLIARDGREIPIDDSAAPIRGASGGVEGAILVFRDVSEKKGAEARRQFLADAGAMLAESLDYEATLAKVAQLSVPRLADWCAVDLIQPGELHPKRVVAHVDQSKAELARELSIKYRPHLEAPRGVAHVLRTGKPQLYPEITDELLRALCVDEEHLRLARELGLRSAMTVPLVANQYILGAISFVSAEGGRLYGEEDLAFAEEIAHRCAIAIDNARRYASEQEARKSAEVATRAKDEFLAVVSHELRTPLNAILGWAKMMRGSPQNEERQAKAMETIERNSLAMAQLIEDLLDMSRVISGQMRLDLQRVDVGSVIAAAVDSVRHDADAKNVTLQQFSERSRAFAAADPTRLQQIVWNLLSNAVKFTPSGGRVQVSARAEGRWVEISVMDTGRGIAPRFLPYVFEPFRQQDGSYRRVHGGLGLGLAITRQLVELHGGHITAASEGEGYGATFTVQVPAAIDAEIAGPASERSPASRSATPLPQLAGLLVLVVDDAPDARELVSHLLTDCGCTVKTAATVDEALAAFRQQKPDILLSDVGMPGRDGYDLIREIRALPKDRGGEVPAAALTAYARGEDRRQLLQAGYSVHLPKPIDPDELIAVVVSLTRFLDRQTANKS
jgi:PAS domain S-box-containing protein